jgi:hypothetical protein
MDEILLPTVARFTHVRNAVKIKDIMMPLIKIQNQTTNSVYSGRN